MRRSVVRSHAFFEFGTRWSDFGVLIVPRLRGRLGWGGRRECELDVGTLHRYWLDLEFGQVQVKTLCGFGVELA